MSTAACPRCHDEVTVPPGAPRHAEVRCPWCREEFTLSEVLDRMPPMLEVLGGASIAPSSNGEEEGFRFAGEEGDRSAERKGEGSPGFDFSGGGAATATAPARPRTGKAATTARPKRKQKSALVEVVKVALGGVVGLFLAQLILWWLPGDWRRDPLDIGPTVGAYAPWIVPAEYRPGTASSGETSGAAAEQTPAQSSSPSQLGYDRQPGGDPAGGDLGAAFQQNLQRSGAEPAETPQGNGELALGPEPDAEAGLPAPPTDPLEIPEPDMTFDPGAALNDDPLAIAPPSLDPSLNPSLDPSPAEEPEIPSLDPGIEPSVPETPTSPEPGEPEAVAEVPAPSELPKPGDVPAETTDPQPAAEPSGGIAGAPSYSAEQVSAAAEHAADAEQALAEADENSATEARQGYYDALADLAEQLTFADEADPQIAEVADSVKLMLSQGNIRERARTLATHQPARLAASAEDRPGDGIVIFGQVEAIEKQGELFTTRLMMPATGGPSVVPVFSEDEPSYKAGARVIVLGAVVDKPAERIAGYDGGLPSVVWAGETVVLQP